MPYSGKYYKLHEKKISEFTPINPLPTPAIQDASLQHVQPLPTQQPLNTLPDNPKSPYAPPETLEKKPIISSTFESIPEPNAPKEKKINTRQLKAIDFITKQGSIKNKQYRKLFGVQID